MLVSLEMKTLAECLPHQFVTDFSDTRAYKLRDVEVVSEHCGGWIGAEKNVSYWFTLASGHAVGFNENPARGWSFPVKKLK